MTKQVDIKKLNIKELINFIENKGLTIPEFQRGFVWKEKQIKNLFDSLIKGYPVGSFIIWKTTQRVGQRNLFIKDMPQSNEKFFVLDGQQRLLSLYYLYKQNNFLKIKELFQEIYEAKQKNLIDFEYFYFEGKKAQKLYYSTDSSCEFDSAKFMRILGNNYRFPVIIVSIDDYKKAIELFERINQAGTRISTEAIFLSEAWNKKSNLGSILRKWKKENKGKMSGQIENIIFIDVFAIILQIEGIKDENKEYDPYNVEISVRNLKKLAEKISEEKSKIYEKHLKKVLIAINDTMSFLSNEFKISDIKELPSQTMVTLLSIFFYYCSEPNKPQRLELKKWFWRSALGNRYIGSGYNENIRKDPIKMKLLAKKRKKLNIDYVDLKFEDLMNTNMKTGRSTIRNCVKLMLWNKRPCWINGEVLNKTEIETRKKKKEDDHFYAYYFKDRGYIEKENEINTILNLVFLSKTENASKQEALPHLWLEERKKELKSRTEDEKRFFATNLLPFSSIKYLKNNERHLIKRGGKIKPNLLRKHFYNFLEDRFELFKKELNRLQRGM